MAGIKRMTAALICAVMVLAFVPAFSVSAEEYSGTCGDNLAWTLDTDTGILTISGTGTMTDYTIELFTAPWFRYRRSITSVVIENGVTNIGIAAFAYCESLTTVNIPNSVTNIGRHAFYDCTSLESMNIPDGVISIGEYAFWWCTSLKSITIPKSITSINQTAFNSCTDLTEIIVDEANDSYCSVDGILFSKDKTKLVICPEGKEGAYSIPDGITSIGNLAFLYCESLESITIPDSVTSIEEGAFNCCTSLTSITIPNSVTSIGDAAFCVCTSLASISIPNSVTSIGESVFESCESLESIAIPNSVTNIGDYAFGYCFSLESILIPNSVTSIGYYAFGWCEALTDVYYGGSEADWVNINIEDGNESLTDATIHYNSTMPVAEQSGGITVTLNGSAIEFDQEPVIVSGRTLVPLRAIFEALGASVDWNGETQSVTAEKDGTSVILTVGETTMYVNGEAKTLDAEPQLINNRTLVPARAIAEAFGCSVDWDNETRTVVILQ